MQQTLERYSQGSSCFPAAEKVRANVGKAKEEVFSAVQTLETVQGINPFIWLWGG